MISMYCQIRNEISIVTHLPGTITLSTQFFAVQEGRVYSDSQLVRKRFMQGATKKNHAVCFPQTLIYKNYMSRVCTVRTLYSTHVETLLAHKPSFSRLGGDKSRYMNGRWSLQKKVGQSHPGLATVESDDHEEASKQAIVLDRNSFAVLIWEKPRHMLLKLSTYSLPPMQLQTHTWRHWKWWPCGWYGASYTYLHLDSASVWCISWERYTKLQIFWSASRFFWIKYS